MWFSFILFKFNRIFCLDFVLSLYLCVQTLQALECLYMCEDTPELLLHADVVSTGISCTGLYEKPLLKHECTSMQLA